MEIYRVQKRDLVRTAQQMLESPGPAVAITPSRAAGQVSNPDAGDEDILLLYVKDNEGEIAGYAGILPGRLPGRPGLKIYWNTCWYADPRYGGQVSIPLLTEFLRITRRKVLFSDLAEKTVAILQHTGGFVAGERTGVILRLRQSLHQRAGGRRGESVTDRALRSLAGAGLLRLTDMAMNRSRNRKLKKYSRPRKTGARAETFDFPSGEQVKFIREHSENQVTRPDAQQISWWMNSRWLTTKDSLNRSLDRRYHFSSFAGEFRYTWIEVNGVHDKCGIALLTFRDGTVKTPYLWYEKKCEMEFFSALFDFISNDVRNYVLITFQEAFAAFIREHAPAFLPKKTKKRYTAVSAEITRRTGENIVLQDGDGDYLFT